MGLTLIGGFGMASFFVYIAMSPFVFTGVYGLTPSQFSVAFAINAAGFFVASQAAGPLGARFGAQRVVLAATTGFAVTAMTLAAWTVVAPVTLPVLVAVLCLGNAFLGLVIPTSMVLALEDHGDRAGLASSYGGTLQMVIGGLMIALTGLFFDGSAARLVLAIALCAALALATTETMLRRPRQPA